MRQSSSSPVHLNFCRTMYSVQSCCLTFSTSLLSEAGLTPRLERPVDCRLVIRTITCRTPELGSSGIWVARSETTRSPVKKVAGVRRYFSNFQLTFSSRARLVIREPKSFARPVQQILRRVSASPLRCSAYMVSYVWK